MDLQQIRYVVALARELNFQRAARSVGISQPTLSQQVQKLERELGTPLFERNAHAVRLTGAGEKFLPFAMGALESLRVGSERVHNTKTQLSGTIRLGFIPTVGPYLLPPAIRVLEKKAPDIHLELFEETTSVLVESVKSGKVDLGLLALPVEDTALASKLIGSEEFLAAVSKKHALAKRKKITASEIAGEDLLMLKEGHCFRDQALEFCRTKSKNPQVAFEGSSLVSVLNLVSTGEGATLVPKMAVQRGGHTGLSYIPFENPKPSREIGVVWRMTMALTAAQGYLIKTIEQVFNQSI